MLNYEFIISYIVIALLSILLFECTKKKITEGMDDAPIDVPDIVTEEGVGGEVQDMPEDAEDVLAAGGDTSMSDKVYDMFSRGFDFSVQIATIIMLVLIFLKVKGLSPSV